MPEENDERTRFIKAFTAMVLSRTLDKKIVTAQRQGRVGFYTPTMGQEATQIGASLAMEPADLIYGYYRDVPLMLHRGVPIETIINQIMGNNSDRAKGRQMPSHFSSKEFNFMSVQSPVATNLPLATGAAYALKYQKKNGIVLATFGDGSSSTPDFHAALNIAGLFDLPVIFLCENNGWAISLPVEKQTKVEIWTKGEAYGVRGVKADGNNFVDTYEKVSEAVKRAREGKGATLIEATSFRMGPHSTSDDPSKYRSENVEEGSAKDPIVVSEKILKEKKYVDDKMIENIKSRTAKLVEEKFNECEKISPPDPSTAFSDVYKDTTWMLKEEVEDIL